MKKRVLILILILLVLIFIPNYVLAHPGRTDANGCHTCRTNCAKWGLTTGEYHCHNGGSKSSSNNSNNKNNSSTSSNTKKVVKSSNNKLDSITIDGKDFTSSLDAIEYKTFDEKVSLEAKANDSKAEIKIDNPNLEIGENEIVIKVTAENGDIKNYKVKVIREQKSNNTNLKVFYEGKELTFKDDFCETEVDYTIEKLDYRYELEDKNATLEIKDKDSLEVGENVLIFYVTAQDGTKKDYKWTVKRQPKIEAENKKIGDEQNNLLILLGAFVIGAAVTSLFWKIKVRSDKR